MTRPPAPIHHLPGPKESALPRRFSYAQNHEEFHHMLPPRRNLSAQRLIDIRRARFFLQADPRLRTPFLIVDLDQVARRYWEMRDLIPSADVFYAVKANSSRALLAHLAQLGAGFDVASAGELHLVSHVLGIPGQRIVFSNPIKNQDALNVIARARPRVIVVASLDGLRQLDQLPVADSSYRPVLLVRMPVRGSNLNKYGSDEEVIPILRAADASGRFSKLGLTFHVGTQSTSSHKFQEALQKCARTIERLAGKVKLDVIDAGGGFPDQRAASNAAVPYRSILTDVASYLTRHLPARTEVFVEPGRALVADAGVIVTQIVARTETRSRSGGTRCLQIDDSLYRNLLGQWHDGREWDVHPFTLDENAPLSDELSDFVITGGSCDGIDQLERKGKKGHRLPKDISVGTYGLIDCAGAYTTSTATCFNGHENSDVVLFSQSGGQLHSHVERANRPWEDLSAAQ